MSSTPKCVVQCIRSDSFAGVERYVANIAPELSQRGWQVHVIGGDPRRMRAELGSIRYSPAVTTRAVAAHLLRCHADTIVHAHMTAAEAAAVAVRSVRRFPLVATRHFAAPRGSTIAGRLAARLIRVAVDRQIATSQFVAASIGEPSIVVVNGVPVNRRPPDPQLMVLVAQRLEREKCTDVALRAWAHSQLRNNGWRLTVAGSGRQEAELSSLVDRLGVGGSVEFVGRQFEMTSLMSRAALFLATTPADAYGFGVVEAMAAGVPVVAACGGGHVETVGAVSRRYLFPVGDWRAAAAMLDSLGGDPVERQREGAVLRAWQREHLSIAAHVDQLEKIYAELGR